MAGISGKVAVVTGAASRRGIGFAIASLLAREGATVVLTDIAAEAVALRAQELQSQGLSAEGVSHDVSDESSWLALMEHVAGNAGPLGILVNNAGIAVLQPISDLTVADFRKMVDINLTGAFIGCKMAMRCMRGRGGAIVNISSVAGIVGVVGTTGYGATKGGIRLLTKSVALEGAMDGIRCNSVHPGAIWTDIQIAARAQNPEIYGKIEGEIPLGRIGDPDDVAEAALFLASDASHYITGAELVVDGGLTAG